MGMYLFHLPCSLTPDCVLAAAMCIHLWVPERWCHNPCLSGLCFYSSCLTRQIKDLGGWSGRSAGSREAAAAAGAVRGCERQVALTHLRTGPCPGEPSARSGLAPEPAENPTSKAWATASPQHHGLLSSPGTAGCQPGELCWVLRWKTTTEESGRKHSGCCETLWILNLFSGVHKKFSLAYTGEALWKLLQGYERPRCKTWDRQHRFLLCILTFFFYPTDVSVPYLNYLWRKSYSFLPFYIRSWKCH